MLDIGPFQTFLIVFAQVSVASAGFMGLIITISGDSDKKWLPRETHALNFIFQHAAGALAFSLLPLFLEQFNNIGSWLKLPLIHFLLGLYTIFCLGIHARIIYRERNTIHKPLFIKTMLTFYFVGSGIVMGLQFNGIYYPHTGVYSLGLINLLTHAYVQLYLSMKAFTSASTRRLHGAPKSKKEWQTISIFRLKSKMGREKL